MPVPRFSMPRDIHGLERASRPCVASMYVSCMQMTSALERFIHAKIESGTAGIPIHANRLNCRTFQDTTFNCFAGNAFECDVVVPGIVQPQVDCACGSEMPISSKPSSVHFHFRDRRAPKVPSTSNNQLAGNSTPAAPKKGTTSGDIRTAHSAIKTPNKPGKNKTNDHQGLAFFTVFRSIMYWTDETKTLSLRRLGCRNRASKFYRE